MTSATPTGENPVKHDFTADAEPERAFEVFTNRLMEWWPHEFTWSSETLELIAIEPREGGRCFERGPHGFEVDWGRVLVWDPPRRLVFTWQIGPRREPQPDPAKASEVEVRFTPAGESATKVEFEHRHIERHGDGSAEYREALDSAQGWPYILGRYADAVANSA